MERIYQQNEGDIIERGYELSRHTCSDSFDMFGETIRITGRTIEDIKKEYLEKDKASIILTGARASINLLRRRLDSDGIEVMKITNSKDFYLTSDNPVTVRDPDDQYVIPSNPENFLSLPLDHKHILLLIPGRPKQDLDKIYLSTANSIAPET